MRKLLILIWLLLPVLVGAYHYGPGQDKMLLDTVDRNLKLADESVANGQWAQAVEAYTAALAVLPSDERLDASQRIRLALAKARMENKQLPAANSELASLVAELLESETTDKQLLAEARSALANSQYYMTWLMRLEGQPRDVWEPEVESARQNYRLLVEQSDASTAKKRREDLESAVRLARMDLSDLQGLPLPSQ